MGDDKNIMVLAFTVDGMAPAKDLERFAETGYKSSAGRRRYTRNTGRRQTQSIHRVCERLLSCWTNYNAFLEDSEKTY